MMKNSWRPRAGAERIGFWLIVSAAVLLLALLAINLVGPVFHALGVALVLAAFVGLLTAANSHFVAAHANRMIGRPLFPLVAMDELAVWRLARLNTLGTFIAAFVVTLLPFWLVALVFIAGGVLAALVFGLPRMRTLRAMRQPPITPTYTSERPRHDQAA